MFWVFRTNKMELRKKLNFQSKNLVENLHSKDWYDSIVLTFESSTNTPPMTPPFNFIGTIRRYSVYAKHIQFFALLACIVLRLKVYRNSDNFAPIKIVQINPHTN